MRRRKTFDIFTLVQRLIPLTSLSSEICLFCHYPKLVLALVYRMALPCWSVDDPPHSAAAWKSIQQTTPNRPPTQQATTQQNKGCDGPPGYSGGLCSLVFLSTAKFLPWTII